MKVEKKLPSPPSPSHKTSMSKGRKGKTEQIRLEKGREESKGNRKSENGKNGKVEKITDKRVKWN